MGARGRKRESRALTLTLSPTREKGKDHWLPEGCMRFVMPMTQRNAPQACGQA